MLPYLQISITAFQKVVIIPAFEQICREGWERGKGLSWPRALRNQGLRLKLQCECFVVQSPPNEAKEQSVISWLLGLTSCLHWDSIELLHHWTTSAVGEGEEFINPVLHGRTWGPVGTWGTCLWTSWGASPCPSNLWLSIAAAVEQMYGNSTNSFKGIPSPKSREFHRL